MFFGASFHPAAAVILWLLPGTVAFCPAQVIAGHIAGVGRPEWNFAGSLSGAVVTIVLHWLLVPRWGMAGAAIATSAACLSNVIVLCAFFLHHSRLPARSLILLSVEDWNLARRVFARARVTLTRNGRSK
jgi:O-antigen/teichoic acid export membrane protein